MCSGSRPALPFKPRGPDNVQIDPARIKRGWYIDVSGTSAINGNTDHTAGIYLNPSVGCALSARVRKSTAVSRPIRRLVDRRPQPCRPARVPSVQRRPRLPGRGCPVVCQGCPERTLRSLQCRHRSSVCRVPRLGCQTPRLRAYRVGLHPMGVLKPDIRPIRASCRGRAGSDRIVVVPSLCVRHRDVPELLFVRDRPRRQRHAMVVRGE